MPYSSVNTGEMLKHSKGLGVHVICNTMTSFPVSLRGIEGVLTCEK